MSDQGAEKPVIRIAFLDVGQGDTIIITCPETHEAIIVDCIDEKAVLDYLKREQIEHLRGVIITHIHSDHYKGVANLLMNAVGRIGMNGCEVLASSEDIDPKGFTPGIINTQWPPDADKHSTLYDESQTIRRRSSLAKLYQWCEENKEKCEILRDTPKSSLPFDGTLVQSLHLLHPPQVHYSRLRRSGLNNISVVLHVEGGNSSALLMGDLEYIGWLDLSAKYPELTCDVLKFPHHGGAWKETEADDLLSALHPSKVIISVGSDNTYDHPGEGVFAALQKQSNIQLLCTQATKSCLAGASVQSEIPAITKKFQDQVTLDSSFLVRPRLGHCPCAGTVVVELGNNPRILQPDPNFHRLSVINAHFGDHHKCRVAP